MSARKIPKNYRNVTGLAASEKAVGKAGFESTLERDFLTLIEFSSDVEKFKTQPLEILWVDDKGKPRRYYPDVLVYYTQDCERPPFLFEVKYRSDLSDNWSEYKPKFKAAISYARNSGWRFKLITEVEIRTQLLDNARFLLPYRLQRSNGFEYTNALLEMMQELKITTPSELLAGVSKDQWSQAKAIPSLWFLVATFQISCDLFKPLNMKSELWCQR